MNPLDPSLYTDPMVVTAGGYLLAFAMTWLLFRFEFEMPRTLSTGLGAATVLLGFSVAFAGHLVGLASFHHLSGMSGSFLFLTSLGIALVG